MLLFNLYPVLKLTTHKFLKTPNCTPPHEYQMSIIYSYVKLLETTNCFPFLWLAKTSLVCKSVVQAGLSNPHVLEWLIWVDGSIKSSFPGLLSDSSLPSWLV